MLTLALDTSTAHGSVAVCDTQGVRFEETFVADRSHSSTLFAVLERAQARGEKWEAIAVGLGPGSYAGIRIAIAAALGLGLASGAKLVGIPSVAALAEGGYVAIGDARRGSFYWTRVEAGICREGPELLSEEELRARLSGIALPVLASEELPAEWNARVLFPSAARLGRLAAQGKGIVSTNDLEPIYLREPHITQPKPR